MNPPPKHVPFDSAFCPDFELVEERRGNLSLFPHTEQLPRLHRALNLEFRNALPDYLARVDRRADSFHKQLLKHATVFFASMLNAARADGLHLEALPDADLVTRLAVVQQVTEPTRRGRLHRFNFYAGADFQPEIRISGRRLVFTEHVIERFSTRVPNKLGAHLTMLLLAFFGSPLLALPVNGSQSFVLPYLESLLAFPFELMDGDLLFTTCLAMNQINTFERQFPTLAFNAHYGPKFEIPRVRHWLPAKLVTDYHSIWERKVPAPPVPPPHPPGFRWHRLAQLIRDAQKEKGFGPGTTFAFLDHVPGPYTVEYIPGQPEPRIDERLVHKQIEPAANWDSLFDQRDYYATHFERMPVPAPKP